jgi:esterase/lipase superfamily enzyme
MLKATLLVVVIAFPSSLATLVPSVAAVSHQVKQTRDLENRTLNDGFNLDLPQPAPSSRIRQKIVFFITNRTFNSNEAERARNENRMVRYENRFESKLDLATTYGWVKIGFPTNRKRGEQNYAGYFQSENPLYNFSVLEDYILGSPDLFQEVGEQAYPNASNPSLLYVHGLDTSFSSAVEQLAQLDVDLHQTGVPIVFSWPSDSDSRPSNAEGISLHVRSEGILTDLTEEYKIIRGISLQSRKYLVEVIDDLAALSPGHRFNIVAHSMGGDLTTNAIALWQSKHGKTKNTKSLDTQAGRSSVILAAPDIGTREFDSTLRPKIVDEGIQLTVYCSDDYALLVSAYLNQSDDRLGYCAHHPPLMPGVNFVSVRGQIKDFARHSYYLSEVKILEDIETMLLDPLADPRVEREIFVP